MLFSGAAVTSISSSPSCGTGCGNSSHCGTCPKACRTAALMAAPEEFVEPRLSVLRDETPSEQDHGVAKSQLGLREQGRELPHPAPG